MADAGGPDAKTGIAGLDDVLDATRDWSASEIALVESVVERCWAHVERVGAQARLRESEARYRDLFENIDAGFCLVEADLGAAGGAPTTA